MTDYEQRTIDEIARKIELNRQYQSMITDWQELSKLRREESRLIWQYNELQQLYYISHLEVCQDLDGNILPNKQMILEEIENDETLQPI